jgi:F0F1-type ATP synthase membrane subunit b/b'
MKTTDSKNAQLAWGLIAFAVVMFLVTIWKFKPV